MARFAHLDDCCGAQASFRDKTVHNETSKPKHLQLDVSNIAVTPISLYCIMCTCYYAEGGATEAYCNRAVCPSVCLSVCLLQAFLVAR